VKPEIPGVDRRRLAIAAAAGVLVIGASVAAVVLRRDHPAPAKPAPAATPGRHFAAVTFWQMRERLEKAGYTVVRRDDKDPLSTATWHLSGAGGYYVALGRFADVKAAEAREQKALQEGLTVARDGVAVLQIHMLPRADALKLLDQLTR
jgi:hypothetical protein